MEYWNLLEIIVDTTPSETTCPNFKFSTVFLFVYVGTLPTYLFLKKKKN